MLNFMCLWDMHMELSVRELHIEVRCKREIEAGKSSFGNHYVELVLKPST